MLFLLGPAPLHPTLVPSLEVITPSAVPAPSPPRPSLGQRPPYAAAPANSPPAGSNAHHYHLPPPPPPPLPPPPAPPAASQAPLPASPNPTAARGESSLTSKALLSLKTLRHHSTCSPSLSPFQLTRLSKLTPLSNLM